MLSFLGRAWIHNKQKLNKTSILIRTLLTEPEITIIIYFFIYHLQSVLTIKHDRIKIYIHLYQSAFRPVCLKGLHSTSFDKKIERRTADSSLNETSYYCLLTVLYLLWVKSGGFNCLRGIISGDLIYIYALSVTLLKDNETEPNISLLYV